MHPCTRSAVAIFRRAQQFHSGPPHAEIYFTSGEDPVAKDAAAFIGQRIPDPRGIILLKKLKLLFITFRMCHTERSCSWGESFGASGGMLVQTPFKSSAGGHTSGLARLPKLLSAEQMHADVFLCAKSR